jgi:hypothetical protein
LGCCFSGTVGTELAFQIETLLKFRYCLSLKSFKCHKGPVGAHEDNTTGTKKSRKCDYLFVAAYKTERNGHKGDLFSDEFPAGDSSVVFVHFVQLTASPATVTDGKETRLRSEFYQSLHSFFVNLVVHSVSQRDLSGTCISNGDTTIFLESNCMH